MARNKHVSIGIIICICCIVPSFTIRFNNVPTLKIYRKVFLRSHCLLKMGLNKESKILIHVTIHLLTSINSLPFKRGLLMVCICTLACISISLRDYIRFNKKFLELDLGQL